MSLNSVAAQPINRIPTEIFNEILTIVLSTMLPDFTSVAVLWNLYRGPWASRSTVVLRPFLLLQGISRHWRDHIINLPIVWSTLALQQMDRPSVQRALERSQSTLLTIIVANPSSAGLLLSVLHQVSHRIRTIYIDVKDDIWETLSPSIATHNFTQAHNIFFSNATMDARSQNFGNNAVWGGGGGVGWGIQPVGGWGMGVGGWGAGAWGNGGATTAMPPIVTPSTLEGYEYAIARLHHMPASVLSLRFSAFAFHHFTPPSQLVRLLLHDAAFYLADLDGAFQACHNLTELELWDVNIVPSIPLQPLHGSPIQYIAVKATPASIHILCSYLCQCAITIWALEVCETAADTLAPMLAVTDVFVSANNIASVGIFVNIHATDSWQHSFDLVLFSSNRAKMSVRLRASNVPIIHAIFSRSITPVSAISFDATEGPDRSNIVRDIFENGIPLSLISTYHLCIEDRHVGTIISALAAASRTPQTTNIFFHGDQRRAAFDWLALTRGAWRQSAQIADEDRCELQEPREPGPWTAFDGRKIFTPSVYHIQDHLMRMFNY